MAEKIYQAVSDGSMQEVSLPEYVCHKVVRAAKIVSMGIGPEPGPDTPLGTRRGIRLALGGAAHVDVSQLWVTSKTPQVGGYYVQYDDGYSSYSPAKAFEEGYVPVGVPSAEDLDATVEEKATAEASGIQIVVDNRTGQGLANAAAGTDSVVPEQLPADAEVTVKGGSGKVFKVSHLEHINGRIFVGLLGLAQLFTVDQLLQVNAQPPAPAPVPAPVPADPADDVEGLKQQLADMAAKLAGIEQVVDMLTAKYESSTEGVDEKLQAIADEHAVKPKPAEGDVLPGATQGAPEPDGGVFCQGTGPNPSGETIDSAAQLAEASETADERPQT